MGASAQPRLSYCTQLCLRPTACGNSKQEHTKCREGREPGPAQGGKDSNRQRGAFGAEAVSKQCDPSSICLAQGAGWTSPSFLSPRILGSIP